MKQLFNIRKHIVITIIVLAASSVNLRGQYVCYDPDGYTNVRSGPGTRYEMVDKVSKYEMFYSWDDLCGNDDASLYDSLSWMPFYRDREDDLKGRFIFRKNVIKLEYLPYMSNSNNDNEDRTHLWCSNDTISVHAVLKDFELSKHFTNETYWEWRSTPSVNGFCPMGSGQSEMNEIKEIDSLYVIQRDRRTDLSIDDIKPYFNIHTIEIYFGCQNDIIIYLGVGDASESAGIYLSVVDGEIKYTLGYYAC